MVRRSRFDLKAIRRKVGLSQSEFADLLGVSLRTIQSCEQGWRNPSPAVEKSALLLFIAHCQGADFRNHTCWATVQCSDQDREGCLVYKTKQGHLCWLLTGHICKGIKLHSWEDKKALCSECDFFRELLPEGVPTR
jgi:DNA-binding XRE family transcriptional regulator